MFRYCSLRQKRPNKAATVLWGTYLLLRSIIPHQQVNNHEVGPQPPRQLHHRELVHNQVLQLRHLENRPPSHFSHATPGPWSKLASVGLSLMPSLWPRELPYPVLSQRPLS